MRISGKTFGAACLLWAALQAALPAANIFRLEEGTPALQSAGPLAFGPQGVLFVGDTKGAAVYAIGTGDVTGDPQSVQVNVDNLDAALAAVYGTQPGAVRVNDLAVNPLSGHVYLSLSVGGDNKPALVRIDATGKLSPVSLEQVLFSKAELPDAPDDQITCSGNRQRNLRDESITDLAFVDGRVMVSGMTKGAMPSAVRSLAFPFDEESHLAGIEIYHAAHGRAEDNAAIRTFVPLVIDGRPNLLAGFTCTPLVRFPLEGIQTSDKVTGTTVAELGNRNRPLDMIVYRQDGETFLLMSNSARGMMKISTNDIEREQGLTEPVSGGGTAGQAYETVNDLPNVVQMDRLGEVQLVVLQQKEGAPLQLQTVPLP